MIIFILKQHYQKIYSPYPQSLYTLSSLQEMIDVCKKGVLDVMISYKAQRNCKRLSSFNEEKPLEEKAEEPVKQEEKE